MPPTQLCRLPLVARLLAAFALLPAGLATAQERSSTAVRAELSAHRTLFSPGQPVRVRCLLVNPTRETVDVAGEWAGAGGTATGLPPAIVFGAEDQPALVITPAEQRPVAIRPLNKSELESEHGSLRLGPGAVLGAEVNLTELYKALRYTGDYKLEWRPLGGQFGSAVLNFRVESRKNAIISTDLGKINIALNYDGAPLNVTNFTELVREGFYNNKTFHRLVPGFLVQGGCPIGTGKGMRPDGRTVPAELSDTPFEMGTVAMAHRPNDVNSASCQFFISLGRRPDFDGQYTIIGTARDPESLRTLQQIAEQPTDARDRPTKPVVMRFVTLIDAENRGSEQFGLQPNSGGP